MANLESWPREWRKRMRTGGAKSINGRGQMEADKRLVMFSSAMATESTVKWASKTMSVIIPFDLLRKRWALMREALLVMARQRWTRWWEGESYPAFVVQCRWIEGESFMVWWQCRWREKSDEEAKKRRTEKVNLRSGSGVWIFFWRGHSLCKPRPHEWMQA
jgi:hypothetical protein